MNFLKIFDCKKQGILILLALGLTACGASMSSSDRHVEPSVYTKALQSAAYHKTLEKYRAEYAADQSNLKALIGLARTLRYAGQAKQALAELEKAESSFGDHPAYLTEVGKANLASGNIKAAKEALEDAIEDDDDNWEAYSALGIVHDYEGNYDKATIAYSRAVELCPESASILNNMGISTGMSGDIRTGRNLLIRALALQPQSDRIKKNIDLFRKLAIKCPNCTPEEYQRMIKSTVLAQDWAYGDLACTTGVQEIVETLSDKDFIDVKVHFEFDKSDLLPKGIETLNAMGQALNSEQLQEFSFDLEGHTDAVGTDEYNQGLSERRAETVRKYLVEVLGIDNDRLNAVGYGESRLLDSENPKSGVNRRVRIYRLK